jgi:hypothetical protein
MNIRTIQYEHSIINSRTSGPIVHQTFAITPECSIGGNTIDKASSLSLDPWASIKPLLYIPLAYFVQFIHYVYVCECFWWKMSSLDALFLK